MTARAQVRVPSDDVRIQLPTSGTVEIEVPALVERGGVLGTVRFRDAGGVLYRYVQMGLVVDQTPLVLGRQTLRLPIGVWTVEVEGADLTWTATANVVPGTQRIVLP